MGILGVQYEGRIVIGLSGHKSENTIKQYVHTLPATTKREMSGTLANNILTKKPRIDNQFNFRPIRPAATVSKAPDNAEPVIEIPLDEPENIPPPSASEAAPNVEIQLEALDDAPPDEQLMNFRQVFDPVNVQNVPSVQPNKEETIEKVANNTINIQNVQQVMPHGMLPAMLFPNSNITINYNFSK